jgi:hypothetical protein
MTKIFKGINNGYLRWFFLFLFWQNPKRRTANETENGTETAIQATSIEVRTSEPVLGLGLGAVESQCNV